MKGGYRKTQVVDKNRDNRAAVTIQRYYRGFLLRREYPKLIKKHRKQIFAAKELLQSERTYC